MRELMQIISDYKKEGYYLDICTDDFKHAVTITLSKSIPASYTAVSYSDVISDDRIKAGVDLSLTAFTEIINNLRLSVDTICNAKSYKKCVNLSALRKLCKQYSSEDTGIKFCIRTSLSDDTYFAMEGSVKGVITGITFMIMKDAPLYLAENNIQNMAKLLEDYILYNEED